MAVAGFAALCQCSPLFDLGGLDNGGPEHVDAATNAGDATTDDGPNADGLGTAGEAEALDASGGDEILGPASDGGNDAGGLDATPDAGGLDGTADDGGLDAAADVSGSEAAAEGGPPDAAMDSGGPDEGIDAGIDAGPFAVGLVAFYPFDEATGTTSADTSGNAQTAMMLGATFAPGLQRNAATMDGVSQYVSLPPGIVSHLTAFSISAWVNLRAAATNNNCRVFDFGTGTNAYMFFTAHPGTRFAITTTGNGHEQGLVAPTALATGSWQHIAVTLNGTTGTLYVNGVQVIQNTAMTLNPASLGSTNQNWLGRSQFAADSYLGGQIDEFRIYNRALTPSEVQQLFQQKQ